MSDLFKAHLDLFKRQLTQGYWDKEMIALIEAEFKSRSTRDVVFHYLYLQEDLGSTGQAVYFKNYPDARADKTWYEKRKACRKAAIRGGKNNTVRDSDFT